MREERQYDIYRIIFLLVLLIIFLVVVALVFVPKTSQNWLFRDSAFFILIMTMLGFLVLYNFEKHQSRTEQRINKLEEDRNKLIGSVNDRLIRIIARLQIIERHLNIDRSKGDELNDEKE